jgi:hypothetical protein
VRYLVGALLLGLRILRAGEAIQRVRRAAARATAACRSELR